MISRSRWTKAFLLFCATALPAAPALAAAPDTARLDALFARWAKPDAPGCQVAVSRNGKAVAERVYGMADLEKSVPATLDSLYEAGSDSKQFTAASILMLARAGTLSLDDDIRKYLPEIPDYGATITIRHLLHHTSGLRDWGSVAAVEGWPRNSRTADNDDVLRIVARQKELNYAPGAHYLYSNSNFNLLAIIVQRASGQSLADYSRDHIFRPLGMSHTSWRDDHGRVVPGRTGAYERGPEGYRNEQVIEDAYGNGGLLTTVGDLTKWQAALDSNAFGPGFTAEMEQPGRLNDGTRIAYALALVNVDHNGVREVSHSGSTGGYRAWMARYPDQKLAVSLLCNTGEADTPVLGRAVADLFLPPHKAKTYVPRGTLPTGVWADRMTGAPVRFDTDAAGHLRANGRVLEPIGPGRWQLREDVFAFTGKGLVREAREGETLPYDKVAEIDAVDPAPYLGRFCAVDNASCVTFSKGDGGLRFDGPRWSAQPLKPAYKDAFIAHPMPDSSEWVIKFRRDAAGQVDSLRLGEGRAYDIEFKRVR